MRDIYGKLTDEIIAKLEAGVQPWFQPWQSKGGRVARPLRANGKAYRGINVINLWMTAESEGYHNPYWMTYNQARALGGHVRKGERGTTVVRTERALVHEGTDDERILARLRTYWVFNCAQINNLPERYYPTPTEPIKRAKHARLIEADTFFGHLDMDLRHGGDQAYWSPTFDYVQMPNFNTFETSQDYYCTLGHEATHWTKPESRCNRDVGSVQRWGNEAYAMEELVAELGAVYIAADLGITAKPRAGHESYIAHWLKVFHHDQRAIFAAASLAEKALRFMHARQPGYVPETEPPPEVVKPMAKKPSNMRERKKAAALAKIEALGGAKKLIDEGWTWARMAAHAGVAAVTLIKWLGDESVAIAG